MVTVLQHPNCTEAGISECGQHFKISIERELLVEMVGETKVAVTIHTDSYEEDWPIIDEPSAVAEEKTSEPAKEQPPQNVQQVQQRPPRRDSPF